MFRDVTKKKSQIEDVTRDVTNVKHRKRGLRYEKSQLSSRSEEDG